ncbi:chitin synthase chs-1-like [Enoplosus armatus]|uniref:chitin synthase chs-1-like n=1 Tax=Enoplosus armatus TaxID=215367 RepID=UPI003994D390
MDEDRSLPKRLWDSCREVPIIEDEQTPWKMIKLLKTISLSVVAVIVFGLALCSKTSFLLLITLSNEGTKTLPDEQKPVALLCIGCSLIASSVLLIQKSIWKACYKSSKLPAKKTVALVLFFEFIVALGAAILTIVAMPHLDIVTNVTILNGVAVFSALLQVITQCTAKERNRFLVPSITAFILILLGYILFLVLYITKDPSDIKMITWVGLAVGGSFLVSFNWWESYLRLISENSSSVFLKNLCRDVRKCQNVLHILSSLLRIAVTACVLGAYVPLAKMDWDIVTSIPRRETKIIAIIIGVQLVSSALCHWFSLVACKMHALRRCFILPLYLASLAVMVLLIVPVIVYYQDYRTSLNGTASINFTGYCSEVVDGRNHSLSGGVFPHLVLDVTHTLCFLDMSKITDVGILTGSAVSWWLGLVLATLHLWHLNLFRIQRTQDLFVRRLYEGGFLEQSLLLNTRFDIQTSDRLKKCRPQEPVKVFLCATMWHETYNEMLKIIISIFRLDKYRPRKEEQEKSDVTFEGHIYFDDAFRDVPGSRGRHVNEYAEMLVEILREVYSIFVNMDKGLFKKQQQVPDQKIVRTPYGGRVVVTMPHGNSLIVHFKDKQLIRHKKRWSQIMYLYYLLGWKVATKYFKRWEKGGDEAELKREFEKEKHNTYLLALDGDTDFQPAAVMLLIDRLKMYPLVGAACGRIHPTGSGPMVWYQKFEYAVGHWLHKTAEHVFGCVLCSPGCFSLFRAAALMDDNVMKKYTVKPSKALHHIQYDQGEDRWLCTLLLKQGWRVEYNAASDAYTNAPEEFKEFYNQRRRWGPSTMANIVDLLGSSTLVSKRNPSLSKPYMLYQLFSLASSILAPSTVVIMIAGSLTVLLDIHPNAALVMAVIPPVIFLGISFKLKSDTQIHVAGIMSILYAFLMMIAALTIIGNMVKDKTILSPSSLFIIALACFYIITALMHPQEVGLVCFGLLYIVCIPSAYLLLAIYSMVNLNNVSWGTRETAPAAGAAKPAAGPPQTPAQKAKSAFVWFFTRAKCCRKLCQRGSAEELIVAEAAEPEPQPQNTIVDDVRLPEEERRQEEPVLTCPNQCWVTQLQSLSDDMRLQEDKLNQEEEQFFRDLTTKYLEPLPENKKKQKEMADQLKELRNKITFVYFICNAFWLIATFTLQLSETSIFIQVPKVDINLQSTGEYMYIDPLGFMFILSFALLVVIQFIAMLYHRICTLIHFVAFLDTEFKSEKQKQPQQQVEDDEVEDSDDLFFPNLLSASQGTLV